MVTIANSRPFSQYERSYIWTRAIYTVIALLMFAVGLIVFRTQTQIVEYAVGVFLVFVADLIIAIALIARRPLVPAMLTALPVDLVAVTMFTAAYGALFDPFYAVAVAFPVLYALVIPKRQAWIVSGAFALAWALGAAFSTTLAPGTAVLFVFKLLAIPLITMLVAEAIEAQRLRESEVLAAADEKTAMNSELQRRLTDLQAVSEITEVIHSTLDFDRVGPVVLEIVAKAIGVTSCALFVVDKERAETIFSASHGLAHPPSYNVEDSQSTLSEEGQFMCMSVLDHRDTGVLFCAQSDEVAHFTDEERLLLSAVASELVVAVENSRLYKLTRRLAITDELTGLNNYRFLQQRLDEEVERAKRYNKDLSLLMIDADDFKSYNDSFGHVAGDVALAELAQVLRTSVREVDVVCRYGGEEFSVLLPETDSAGAFVVAEKIREAVAHHLFLDGEGKAACQITVSVGLATMPMHAEDREVLLREADDALYRAKHGGKNRVRTPVRGADRTAAHTRTAASVVPSPTATDTQET